jgi:hypothetical protein
VSFARRFGGVRRLSPKCFGTWKICWDASASTSQNMAFARRFGGVSLKVQMCLGVFCSYRCECVVCATFWRCSATLAQVFWGLEDPREREYAACATFRRCFRGPDVFGLSPQVIMCRLRDVLEVSGGSGPCVWGLEGPCEWEDAVCAMFRVCFAESGHVSMRLPLQARMCRLRDVSEVFL